MDSGKFGPNTEIVYSAVYSAGKIIGTEWL